MQIEAEKDNEPQKDNRAIRKIPSQQSSYLTEEVFHMQIIGHYENEKL